MISFWVPGVPQPGGSKRGFVHKHTGRVVIMDDAKKNKPWRVSVQGAATAAHSGPPLQGPLSLRVTFVLPRPKGHFRTGKYAHLLRDGAPPYPTTKPDCTKLLRSTEDALSGVCWLDDAQIVKQHIDKIYGDRPGAQITVFVAMPNPAFKGIPE